MNSLELNFLLAMSPDQLHWGRGLKEEIEFAKLGRVEVTGTIDKALQTLGKMAPTGPTDIISSSFRNYNYAWRRIQTEANRLSLSSRLHLLTGDVDLCLDFKEGRLPKVSSLIETDSFDSRQFVSYFAALRSR